MTHEDTQNKLDARAIVGAIMFGLIVGSALFAVRNFFDDFFPQMIIRVTIVACGTILFLVFMSRQRHRMMWMLVGGALLLLVGGAVNSLRGVGVKHFQLFTEVAFPLWALICVGAALLGVSEKKFSSPREVITLFFAYVHKAFEAWVLTTLGAIAAVLLMLMSYQLFRIVNIDIIKSVSEFVFLSTSSIIGFITIALVYDFAVSLGDQKSVFGVIPVFTTFAFGVFWVATVFSFLYLLILVPSGFQLILKTGETVPTFLALVFVGVASAYASLVFLEHRGRAGMNGAAASGMLVLSLTDFVLVGVAAYALSVRIAAYGLTFDRMVGAWILCVTIVLLAAWCIFFARFLRQAWAATSAAHALVQVRTMLFCELIGLVLLFISTQIGVIR